MKFKMDRYFGIEGNNSILLPLHSYFLRDVKTTIFSLCVIPYIAKMQICGFSIEPTCSAVNSIQSSVIHGDFLQFLQLSTNKVNNTCTSYDYSKCHNIFTSRYLTTQSHLRARSGVSLSRPTSSFVHADEMELLDPTVFLLSMRTWSENGIDIVLVYPSPVDILKYGSRPCLHTYVDADCLHDNKEKVESDNVGVSENWSDRDGSLHPSNNMHFPMEDTNGEEEEIDGSDRDWGTSDVVVGDDDYEKKKMEVAMEGKKSGVMEEEEEEMKRGKKGNEMNAYDVDVGYAERDNKDAEEDIEIAMVVVRRRKKRVRVVGMMMMMMAEKVDDRELTWEVFAYFLPLYAYPIAIVQMVFLDLSVPVLVVSRRDRVDGEAVPYGDWEICNCPLVSSGKDFCFDDEWR